MLLSRKCAVILSVVFGVGVLAAAFGCAKKDSLRERLESFSTVTEMDKQSNHSRFEELKRSALRDKQGVKKLASLYLTDNYLDKKVVYLSWALTYEVEKEFKKEQLVALFLLALSDDDASIAGFAAAGLVNLPRLQMESVFRRMCKSKPLQLHGIRGLLRIGTSQTIDTVLRIVQRKRKRGVGMCDAIDVMCDEGLPGETEEYVSKLVEGNELSVCGPELRKRCENELSK